MKAHWKLLCVLLCAVLLAGCGATATPTDAPAGTATPNPTQIPTATPAPTPTPNPTPTPEPTPDANQVVYNAYTLSRYPTEQLAALGLSEAWPKVVDALSEGVVQLNPADFGVDQAALEKLVQCYESYHPLRELVMSFEKKDGGIAITYRFEDAAKHVEKTQAFITAVNGALKTISPSRYELNDLELIISTHLYMTRQSRVDYGVPGGFEDSAYGWLILSKCQCIGYAEMEAFLLNQLGIEAYRVRGFMGSVGDESEHGWIALEYEGTLYWSDPSTDRRLGFEKGSLVTLLSSDAEMKAQESVIGRTGFPVVAGFAPFAEFTPPAMPNAAFPELHDMGTMREGAKAITLSMENHVLTFTTRAGVVRKFNTQTNTFLD